MAEVDAVDTAAGLLDKPDSLECFRQTRVAGQGLVHEQVVDVHPRGEWAWAGNQQVIWVPLDVDPALASVVTMEQRIVERFTETLRCVVRHRETYKADANLAFLISGTKAFLDVLGNFEDGPLERLIHSDTAVGVEDLEVHSVSRQKALDGLPLPEQQ